MPSLLGWLGAYLLIHDEYASACSGKQKSGSEEKIAGTGIKGFLVVNQEVMTFSYTDRRQKKSVTPNGRSTYRIIFM